MDTPLWLEILKVTVSAIGSVALPVVILLISKQATDALKSRELSTKYVELALSILTEEPSDENKDLRDWAIQTLNLHADIKLPEKSTINLLTPIKLLTSLEAQMQLAGFDRELQERAGKYIDEFLNMG